ncbi:glycosyltransferase family A protein [Shewanella sp. DAU305]|uniref:glycosyltransferase family A protein n=1 Tax=Shewanella sp. DAU305 TaxID=2991940 RepID=UPI0022849EEE|nr:glycosyltransferase family 2 protein [Shewanella sp. DAU305]WAL80251.1 glycosyltransferase family 2 protein [Shewanella sp. DAU305]
MNIGLVTPLHNEIDSIDQLFASIESQDLVIEHWVIVENGSNDGSKIALSEKLKPKNVVHLHILNEDRFGGKHELGFKYASIIRFGFDYLLHKSSNNLDFIGILDADCFPESDYYSVLTNFLTNNPEVGITSGRIYLNDGKMDIANPNWVRGGCRLWRFNCFSAAGYVIGPSADAISSARAAILGWSSVVSPNAKVYSREVGVKVNYEYYGFASYYRGCSLFYGFIKCLYLFPKKPSNALGFAKGFFGSFIKNKERIQDENVFHYFNNQLFRKFVNKK